MRSFLSSHTAAILDKPRLLALATVCGAIALGVASFLTFRSDWPGYSLLALAVVVGLLLAFFSIAMTKQRQPVGSEAPKRFDTAHFVDDAHEAAFIIDLAGRIEKSNAHFAALLGIDLDKASHCDVTEALPTPIVDAIATALDLGLDSTGTIECENWIGESLVVELRPRRFVSADGPAFAFIMRDLTEARRREIELIALAFRDPLTHLGNRAAIQQRLSRLADDLAEGPAARYAVMLIDLNDFKQINDELGHGAGDQLLSEIAQRIVKAVPRNGFVGRNGGDEFVVVIGPRATHAAARYIASQIVEAVGQSVSLGAMDARVGASIGIALAPADGVGGATLLAAADAAMYRAKRSRSNVAFAGEPVSLTSLKSVA